MAVNWRGLILGALRWAIKAGIPIQPVIRAKDRDKKEDFLKLAPNDIQEIFRQNDKWIVLDRNDIDFWNVGTIWECLETAPQS